MATYIPQIDRCPQLFLSYSSDDAEFALRLADDLNVCEVDVWIDQWEIEAGDSLFDKISAGIADSKYIALLYSPSFLAKQWAGAEVKAAFSRDMREAGKVIIPLMIENGTVPSLLADKTHISFEKNYYHNLTKLAGLVHGLSVKDLSITIARKNPQCLDDVVNTLAYAGKDPHMIIPKEVFDEIAATGFAEVEGDRLSFPSQYFLDEQQPSERTKNYLKRVYIGVDRNPHRMLN